MRAILAVALLLAGCAGEPPSMPALWAIEKGLVHCYATLADPECAHEPVPGAERRLIAAAPRLTFVPVDPGAESEEDDAI